MAFAVPIDASFGDGGAGVCGPEHRSANKRVLLSNLFVSGTQVAVPSVPAVFGGGRHKRIVGQDGKSTLEGEVCSTLADKQNRRNTAKGEFFLAVFENGFRERNRILDFYTLG